MKVLFININRGIEQGIKNKPIFTKPPIAYLWLSAIIEQYGNEADVYDAVVQGATEKMIVDYIEKTKPEIIGFTVFTITAEDVKYLSRKIKQLFPSIFIIAGGYHATNSFNDLMDQTSIDFVCIGEGDYVLTELIEALEGKKQLKDICGLVYKEEGNLVVNPKRILRKDMDNVPILAYDKVKNNNYLPWWSIKNHGKQRFMSTVTGKGCPMGCVWCNITSTEGPIYRCMSSGRVLKELVHLKDELGITHLSFDDADFAVYKARLIKICQEMIEKNLNIKWSCMTSIVHADDIHLLQTMSSAGCEVIFYGVESGNDKILKKVKKVGKDTVRRVILNTFMAGIKPHCSFILGLPDDTKETMEETINFAIELNPASASFSIATPFKGTPLYEEYNQKGFIKIRDWRKYDTTNAVFETKEISAAYLEAVYIRAHRRFFLRTDYILERIRNVSSISEIFVSMKIGLGFLFKKIAYKN